jgi:cytochrome c
MHRVCFAPAGVLCKSALLLSAALLSVQASASEALARKNDCLGCHAVATKLVGPAYKDVAAKYAGQADAQALLVQSIRNGSVGKWGELPMPAHSKLSDGDAKKLAAWVLSLK